jgi:hypothetical protein
MCTYSPHIAVLVLVRNNCGMYFYTNKSLRSTPAVCSAPGDLYSQVGYSRWEYGEPNNHKDEDCVVITWNALINDLPCTTVPSEFFCEKTRLVPHDPY